MILCIDLKSYYASVECALRGLDPFKTNLVVADRKRGNGSIVLAVTPCMKSHGAKSRCRIFELPKNVYPIYAKPRMKMYIEYSKAIYKIYLRYVSKEDIHVYSIDEAFLDLTCYMKYYGKEITEIAKEILDTIYQETKITATAGIGENMFLAKVGLDILAKHNKSNIGYVDNIIFKEKIWMHEPITDIWGIGVGMQKRLLNIGITNLKGIYDFGLDKMNDLFGVNGVELYKHSIGYDDSIVKNENSYVPMNKSIGNGQVLFTDYNFKDAFIILEEMTYKMVVDMHKKKIVGDTVYIGVRYSKDIGDGFSCQSKLLKKTNSFNMIMDEVRKLYFKNVLNLPIRNIFVRVTGIQKEEYVILDLFSDPVKEIKEKKLFNSIVEIQKRFGKNAINKAISLTENATLIKRNQTIGGHNAI